MLAHSAMGGHCTEKMYTGRGSHRIYIVDRGNSLGWGPDVEIMVQPSSLAARNFSSSQKFLKKYSAVCQIYLKKVVINPIFYYFL